MISSFVHQVSSFEVIYLFFFKDVFSLYKDGHWESYPMLTYGWILIKPTISPMCGSHVRNISHNLWEQDPKDAISDTYSEISRFGFVFSLLAI